ncbi:hypothetical protein OKW43_000860 [Paraburkholderia sp. WC7.3g]
MFSLKTRDHAEAKRLLAVNPVRTDEQFAAARRARASAKTDTWTEQMAAMSREDAYPDEIEAELDRENEANPEYFDGLARARQQVAADADAILNAYGLPTISQLDALRAAGGFHPGDLPTPEQAARVTGLAVAPNGGTVSRKDASATNAAANFLRDVVPSWKARNTPKQSSIGRAEKAINLFEQAVGVVPLGELRKAHGVAFVHFLLDGEARGFGRKTAKNPALRLRM